MPRSCYTLCPGSLNISELITQLFFFFAEQSTRRNHFNHKLVHDNQTSFRLTLDSKAKAGQVKGFVVNPRKDDVKVFDFSENDDQVIEVFKYLKCHPCCLLIIC